MAAPSIKVAGPGHHYIGSAGGALYLGTCERSPQIQLMREWDDVMNAIGGVKIPTDRAFQGEHAIISSLFTRFDRAAYDEAADYGTKLGQLLIQDGWKFVLTIVFPYMGTGLTFPLTELSGPDNFDDIVTTAMKVGLVFHGWPTPKVDGSFGKAYTWGASGVPAPQ